MSQVMIPDVSQPICLEQLRKTLSNIVRLNQITNLVYAMMFFTPFAKSISINQAARISAMSVGQRRRLSA